MGWNDEHPSIFSVGCASDVAGQSKISVARQPLVFCVLEGVQIPALIDTGSMKSIISSRALRASVRLLHMESSLPLLSETYPIFVCR